MQARLQNHARSSKRPLQELLHYYAMERFLYRLTVTRHRARFILKGALMLHVWDALGFGDVVTPGAQKITCPPFVCDRPKGLFP